MTTHCNCNGNLIPSGNDFYLAIALKSRSLVDGEVVEIPFDFEAADTYDARIYSILDGKTLSTMVGLKDGTTDTVFIDAKGVPLIRAIGVEVTGELDGRAFRAAEKGFLSIVEFNGEAHVVFTPVTGGQQANLVMTLTFLPSAAVVGKNAYEIWKEEPGNQDKTLADFIYFLGHGESAYEIAVRYGYTGTEAEYNMLYFDAVDVANTAGQNAQQAADTANEMAAQAQDAAELADTATTNANNAATAAAATVDAAIGNMEDTLNAAIAAQDAEIASKEAEIDAEFATQTALINQKQMEVGAVPSDLTPTPNSTNWATSGGIYNSFTEVYKNICTIALTNTDSSVELVNGYINASHEFATSSSTSMRTYKFTNDSFKSINAYVRNTDALSYAVSMFSSSTISDETFVDGVKFSGSAYDNIQMNIPSNVALICVTTKNTYLSSSHFETYSIEEGLSGELKESSVAVEKTLYQTEDVEIVSNETASSSNYSDIVQNNNHRGQFLIDVSGYEYYTVTVNAHNGYPLSGAIALKRTTAYSDNIVDTGWFGGQMSLSKSDAPNAVYLAILAKFYNSDSTSPSFQEFLDGITFKIELFETVSGLVEKTKELEVKIESLEPKDNGVTILPPVDWTSQLLTNHYYGEKVLPSGFDNTYTSQKVGTLSNGTSTRQGGAFWGKYLFQFHNTFATCVVYDMSTNENIQVISMTGVSNFHAGSGGFSSQFYDSGDMFPLLYISSMDTKQVYVYRVVGEEGNWSLSLIQTIRLNTTFYLPNIAIDATRGKMVIFGYTQNSWGSSTNNKVVICTCDIPEISEDMIVWEFENLAYLPFIYAMQGAYCTPDKLYVSYGNTAQSLGGGIIVYDYTNKDVVNLIGLNSAMAGQEPEALAFYNSKMIVTTQSGNVYELTF